MELRTVTFKKITTGVFDVLLNGSATKYSIINGSAGLSDRDTFNMYGIATAAGNVRWIGTLHAAKSIVTTWLKK